MRTLEIDNSFWPRRISLTVIGLMLCVAVGNCGALLAQHSTHDQVKVTRLSQRQIIEKLDGKPANVTVEEVHLRPGQKDSAHRHTGAVFGYVLEGEYEHALDDGPVETYRVGETFYEPSGSLHRIARNPNEKTSTRLLAVFLHPRDEKRTTIPVKEDEK